MSALDHIVSFKGAAFEKLSLVPVKLVTPKETALLKRKILEPSEEYLHYIECPFGCGELEEVHQVIQAGKKTYSVLCIHGEELQPAMPIPSEEAELYRFNHQNWKNLHDLCLGRAGGDEVRCCAVMREVLAEESQAPQIPKPVEKTEKDVPLFAIMQEGEHQVHSLGPHACSLLDTSRQSERQRMSGIVTFVSPVPPVELQVACTEKMSDALKATLLLLTTKEPRGVVNLDFLKNPKAALNRHRKGELDFSDFIERCDAKGNPLASKRTPGKLYHLIARPKHTR